MASSSYARRQRTAAFSLPAMIAGGLFVIVAIYFGSGGDQALTDMGDPPATADTPSDPTPTTDHTHPNQPLRSEASDLIQKMSELRPQDFLAPLQLIGSQSPKVLVVFGFVTVLLIAFLVLGGGFGTPLPAPARPSAAPNLVAHMQRTATANAAFPADAAPAEEEAAELQRTTTANVAFPADAPAISEAAEAAPAGEEAAAAVPAEEEAAEAAPAEEEEAAEAAPAGEEAAAAAPAEEEAAAAVPAEEEAAEAAPAEEEAAAAVPAEEEAAEAALVPETEAGEAAPVTTPLKYSASLNDKELYLGSPRHKQLQEKVENAKIKRATSEKKSDIATRAENLWVEAAHYSTTDGELLDKTALSSYLHHMQKQTAQGTVHSANAYFKYTMDVNDLFRKIDTNNDGFVSREEFISWHVDNLSILES